MDEKNNSSDAVASLLVAGQPTTPAFAALQRLVHAVDGWVMAQGSESTEHADEEIILAADAARVFVPPYAIEDPALVEAAEAFARDKL